MKLNWGSRIALLYGGFVVLIVILVAGSMRQSFDLVAPDYYGQEIKYQNVMDAGKNQSALSAPVGIQYDANAVTFVFPDEFKSKAMTGTVQFYSPVNSAWDKVLPVNTDNNTMLVPRTELRNTAYTVKLSWESEGKKYYQESELKLH